MPSSLLPARPLALAAGRAPPRVHGDARAAQPRRPGHPADVHPHVGHPLAAVPVQVRAEPVRRDDGLIPANGPFGGIARMATISSASARAAARSLWLDSGDCFQGAPVFNLFKGEAEMRALPHGAGRRGARQPRVRSRREEPVREDRQLGRVPAARRELPVEDPPNPGERSLRDVVQPYAIYDVDGLKVGVIGMGNTSSMTGIYEGGNSLGLPAARRRAGARGVRAAAAPGGRCGGRGQPPRPRRGRGPGRDRGRWTRTRRCRSRAST